MTDLTAVYVLLGIIIAMLYFAFLGWIGTRYKTPSELYAIKKKLETIENEIRSLRK